MPVRKVTSNQAGIHQNLETVVRKHLQHPWRKPLSHFAATVFADIETWLEQTSGPLILDSGCGIGESSVKLAELHPESRVIGFDRSEVRLDKLQHKTSVPENCLVIRADADDLWRQLVNAGIRVDRHYLLFPNPYPKAAQLNQRWHGSPLFPYLLEMGGKLEVRTNWQTYVDEFQLALNIAANIPAKVEAYHPSPALSAFEIKYHEDSQPLWRLTADLSSASGLLPRESPGSDKTKNAHQSGQQEDP